MTSMLAMHALPAVLAATCRLALRVGAGEFGPERPEVWEFSESSSQTVKSWLAYRMREGSGRRASPLDEIRPTRWTAQYTRELLELLWVLEKTVKRWPELAELVDANVAGEGFGRRSCRSRRRGSGKRGGCGMRPGTVRRTRRRTSSWPIGRCRDHHTLLTVPVVPTPHARGTHTARRLPCTVRQTETPLPPDSTRRRSQHEFRC